MYTLSLSLLQQALFFRAGLGSHQNWAEDTAFPHNPSPHSCRTGHYQHPASGCAFARTDDSSRHRIITQGPQRALGFTLGAAHPVGFDKCIRTGTHHCSIIQNGFTALKILCTLPFHSSLLPTLANHWPFNCFHSSAFSKMSYSWNHRVCSLFGLASFT